MEISKTVFWERWRGRGHAILEPKFLTRVKDFLGDERFWKGWFANMSTAAIQMYPDLAEEMETAAVRAENILNWDSFDGCIANDVRDEYAGPLWAVLVQHTGGEARTVVLHGAIFSTRTEKRVWIKRRESLHAFLFSAQKESTRTH